MSRHSCRCRWTGIWAATWGVVFAAPHVWWAFGVPAGFPGGETGLAEALAVPWFRAYDLLVVALSAAAMLVAWSATRRQPVGIAVAWVICSILLVRGLVGLMIDGVADLVWSPMFVVGGLLFGATARQCGHSASDLKRDSGAGANAAGT